MSRTVVAVAAVVLVAASARAQTDQLECFKIKDARRKAIVSTLLQGIAAPHGCTIKLPAKLVCLPAVRPAVSGPGSRDLPAGANANAFLCYEVECEPGAAVPPLVLGDMFGERGVKPGRSRLFCTPVANDPGESSTTTTTLPVGCLTTTTGPFATFTTTTTVTTTTMPPMPPPLCERPNTTCGSCGNGACQPSRPEGLFLCTFQTQGFCQGSCESSADCPDGKFCVGSSGEFGRCCTPCF